MKILLATDGSPCSDAAVNEVARSPWPANSEVKVISVVEMRLPGAPADRLVAEIHFLEWLKALQGRARDAVDRAVAKLEQTDAERADRLRIDSEIIDGNVKETIVNEAERWGADLIVVGSHGHHGMKRLWLGSVSAAVLAHANCPVRIARCTQRASA